MWVGFRLCKLEKVSGINLLSQYSLFLNCILKEKITELYLIFLCHLFFFLANMVDNKTSEGADKTESKKALKKEAKKAEKALKKVEHKGSNQKENVTEEGNAI